MRLQNGTFEENEMIALLNKKTFDELNNNAKYFVKQLFGPIEPNQIIYAEKVDGFIKPDFMVRCNDEKCYISMKSGTANVFHQEYASKFADYLRSKGISEETIETILLYHYGDGTVDGTGKERIPYHEVMVKLGEKIKKANFELNTNKKFVIETMERCIFTGTDSGYTHADYIYHGNAGFGVLVSHQQLMKHINMRDWLYMNNLHIGPLQLRPHARYVDRDIANEKSRHSIDFYWANLFQDLEYISRRYD